MSFKASIFSNNSKFPQGLYFFRNIQTNHVLLDLKPGLRDAKLMNQIKDVKVRPPRLRKDHWTTLLVATGPSLNVWRGLGQTMLSRPLPALTENAQKYTTSRIASSDEILPRILQFQQILTAWLSKQPTPIPILLTWEWPADWDKLFALAYPEAPWPDSVTHQQLKLPVLAWQKQRLLRKGLESNA